MAVLWRHHDLAGNRYEVRTAGTSLRLYTNGIFHSQYNPHPTVAGNVWNLLLLPVFLEAASGGERVLVLGVGGGAVIRQLNDVVRPGLIIGIELNPVHLHVAQRYFQAGAANVTLLQADARHWLDAYRGPGFDLIIDDLFGDDDGEPFRAIDADAGWCRNLIRHLTPKGRLVMNFDRRCALMDAAPMTDPQLRSLFSTGLNFSTPHYANQIGVFCRQRPNLAAFENRLARAPQLDRRRLNFTVEKLFG